MAFTRKFLKDLGIADEVIDSIMAEHGQAMATRIPPDEVQRKIDAALEEERKKTPKPVPPTESQEYKELLDKYNMVTILNSEDFASIKPKFREAVYKMLDHGDKHKPYAEQLNALKEQFEEYFNPTQPEPPKPNDPKTPPTQPKTPQWGAPPAGGVPGGGQAPSFLDGWGYNFIKK